MTRECRIAKAVYSLGSCQCYSVHSFRVRRSIGSGIPFRCCLLSVASKQLLDLGTQLELWTEEGRKERCHFDQN